MGKIGAKEKSVAKNTEKREKFENTNRINLSFD